MVEETPKIRKGPGGWRAEKTSAQKATKSSKSRERFPEPAVSRVPPVLLQDCHFLGSFPGAGSHLLRADEGLNVRGIEDPRV